MLFLPGCVHGNICRPAHVCVFGFKSLLGPRTEADKGEEEDRREGDCFTPTGSAGRCAAV